MCASQTTSSLHTAINGTYCGINAHFQNGIPERAIRNIMEARRKQLLHAMARWPNAVNLGLWSYALCYAVHLYNTVPILSDRTSRLEKFSGTSIGMHMQCHHTFACPMFALQNMISAGNMIPRWSPHARLGLNLGPSPFHAWSMYLVLNLAMGLVSLQYHYCFDDFFETTHHNQPDIVTSAT